MAFRPSFAPLPLQRLFRPANPRSAILYPRPPLLQTHCPRLPKISTRPASQWGPITTRRPPPRYNRFNRAQRLYNLWHTSPGFRVGVGAIGVGGGVFYYTNLERVPISGRLRFNCISPGTEETMAAQQLQGVMQEFGSRVLPPHHPYSKLVNRVIARLIPAAGLEDQNWEVKVIDDPSQKNAFVLPGGKVFVFSGILDICQGDDGLAAVLGHEIAHNLAHHTGEKMSQLWFVIPLAVALAYTLDISGQLAQFAVDLALSRPGSRKQESEADYIGLLMMAQACYDPNAAVGLWERMSTAEQYTPPQFLSTHPASRNRITTIQQWLPQAEEKRAQSECGSTIRYAPRFKEAMVKYVDDDGFF